MPSLLIFLCRVRSGLTFIGHLEMFLASLILFGIVLMICVQVLLNAGLGNPITWEQEGGAYALVWLTFIAASLGLKRLRHVTIISFVGYLPVRLRYLVRLTIYSLILWTLFILLRELFPIMTIESRSTSIALPIDLPRSYFFSVPLIFSCCLMIMTCLLFLFESLVGFLFGDLDGSLLTPIGSDESSL